MTEFEVTEFQELSQRIFGMVPEVEVKLLASVVALLFLWLVRRLLYLATSRFYNDVSTRYQFRKTSGYIISALGILLLGRIWFDGFGAFTTFLGLVSAGLVIALKDMLIDMAGWLFIIWRQPFHVGDRIQIGDLSGDVIDIRVFQFSILEIGNWVDADQSTGRVVHIPNGKVFSEAQANYSQGFSYIWDEIPVTITFESDWQHAKELLQEIATRHTGHLSEEARDRVRQAAEKYFIFYSKLTPTVYTSVKENGIVLTMRYLSEPRRRRGNAQAIWEDVLREFIQHPDITFAYPTYRLYNQMLEGPVGGPERQNGQQAAPAPHEQQP